MKVSERFWSKVDKTDGCWLWTRGLARGGYGGFRVAGKQVLAHRWSYAESNGPIPAGLEIDHVCHNQDLACPGGAACIHRRCVRPDHLEAVTSRTNTLRSAYAPASINAQKTTCPLGHPLTMKPSADYRYCPECRRKQDRDRRMQKRREAGVPAGRGIRETLKTHCPQGHEYTPSNTRLTKAGGRVCRTCEAERSRQRAKPQTALRVGPG